MINFLFYDPTNWYWVVAGSTTKVFKSATMRFVLVSDSDYVAWLAAGNAPTSIPSNGELFAVLDAQAVPRILGNGVALESTGTPALNATYDLGSDYQVTMMGLLTIINAGQVPGGASTFMFDEIEFTTTQFQNVCNALMNYSYNYSLALGTYLDSDGASGSFPTQPIVIA